MESHPDPNLNLTLKLKRSGLTTNPVYKIIIWCMVSHPDPSSTPTLNNKNKQVNFFFKKIT